MRTTGVLPRAINTIYDGGPIQAHAAACAAARARARGKAAVLKPGSRFPGGFCSRRRKFRIGQPDDGLPRRHGRRGRRPHPRQLESRKRDVASAQREPPGARLARRDEAPSAPPRAAPHPSSPAHARASSSTAATAAASRGLHAAVLLVPGGPQPGIAHVSAKCARAVNVGIE